MNESYEHDYEHDAPSGFDEPDPQHTADDSMLGAGGDLLDAGMSVGDEVEPFSTDPGPRLPEGAGLPELVHGGPENEFWQQQSENGFCVPMSTVMVLNEFGIPATEFDVVQTAFANGWLAGEPGAWQGMTAEGAEDLLQTYGIEAHVERDQDGDDLVRYLDENRGIIVCVDSDELWFGKADDAAADDAGADHAVVITAIDEASGTVTLNDPGQPEGMGYTIPLDQFLESWDDGGSEMIVTDVTPPPPEQPAPMPVAGPGPCVLPVVLPPECSYTPVLTDANPITEMVAVAEQQYAQTVGEVWAHLTGGAPPPANPDGSPMSPDQVLLTLMSNTPDQATRDILQDIIDKHRAGASNFIQ